MKREPAEPAEPAELGPWTTLRSRIAYQNPWITVHEHDVITPNGAPGIYGVVDAGQACGVLPFVGDGDGDRDTSADAVVLVRQWRYIIDRPVWEMPTGKAEGSDLEAEVRRELREETGYDVARLVHVNTHNTSKSILDETAHLFLGYGCTPVAADSAVERDATEKIEVATFPFDTVLQMVLDGEIVDAMTIIAVLLAARAGGRQPVR